MGQERNVKLAPFEKFLNFRSRKKKIASLKTLCFLFFFVKKHDLFLFAPVARNLRTKSEIQAWQQRQPQRLTESLLLDPQNASFLWNYISFAVVNHLNPSVEIYGLLINSVSTFGERIFIEEQWALFNGIDLKSGFKQCCRKPSPHSGELPAFVRHLGRDCGWLLPNPGFVEQLGEKNCSFFFSRCSFKYQKYHCIPMLIFPISKAIWENEAHSPVRTRRPRSSHSTDISVTWHHRSWNDF